MNSEKYTSFGHLLITWYRENSRQLPWRNTRDPYAIWLSEIILQQTRIQQGLSYYLRFLDTFPSVKDLANAPADEVLKLWQGLGYYTRARNLHDTARVIQSTYNGVFPSDYQSVRKLKGIGDYTAAAITSICFGLPYPVLDGNVYRVMTRYLALNEPVNSTSGKKRVMDFLTAHITTTEPGDFNQALMELGALLCSPKNPDCVQCPLNQQCKAFSIKKTEHFPVAAPKKLSKTRYFNYVVFEEVIEKQGFTYLKKRLARDIWKGLYEFPLFESDKKLRPDEILSLPAFQQIFPPESGIRLSQALEMTHILTHQKLDILFFTAKYPALDPGKLPQGWIKVPLDKLKSYPVSRMTEKFLEQFFFK